MTDYPDYILEAYDVIEKLLSPQECIITRNAAMSDALHNALLRVADKAVEDYKAEQLEELPQKKDLDAFPKMLVRMFGAPPKNSIWYDWYKAELEDIKGSMAKAQHTTTTIPQDCL